MYAIRSYYEITEGWRMEGGAIAGFQTVIWPEAPAGTGLPGVVAAILLVIVTAATQLSGPDLALVLGQGIEASVFPFDILCAKK